MLPSQLWMALLLILVERFCLIEIQAIGIGINAPPGSARFSAVGVPHRPSHISDESAEGESKAGAFKINDGAVLGAGTFEISPEGQVDIGVNLKIQVAPEGGAAPAPVPGGAPPPSGGETPVPAPATGGAPTPSGGETPAPAPAPGEGALPSGGETPAPAPSPVGGPLPGGGEAPLPAPGGAPAPGETPAPAPSPGEQPSPGGGETPAPAPGGAPAAGETPSPGASGSDFEQEGLEAHNKYRAIHNAPPMKLNAEMSAAATEYAKQIAAQGSLSHAQGIDDGENLSMGCGSSGQTAAEAVKNWYMEVCDYTFGSGFSSGTGHFTQVVWKKSTELGMGKADTEQNGMKCTYIVGRYKPAGNFGNDYAENVEKGSFDKASTCSRKKTEIFGKIRREGATKNSPLQNLKPRGFIHRRNKQHRHSH